MSRTGSQCLKPNLLFAEDEGEVEECQLAVDGKGLLFAMHKAHLACYDPDTGLQLYTVPVEKEASHFVVGEDYIFITSENRVTVHRKSSLPEKMGVLELTDSKMVSYLTPTIHSQRVKGGDGQEEEVLWVVLEKLEAFRLPSLEKIESYPIPKQEKKEGDSHGCPFPEFACFIVPLGVHLLVGSGAHTHWFDGARKEFRKDKEWPLDTKGSMLMVVSDEWLLYADEDGELHQYNWKHGAAIRSIKMEWDVAPYFIGALDTRFYVMDLAGTLLLYNLETGEQDMEQVLLEYDDEVHNAAALDTTRGRLYVSLPCTGIGRYDVGVPLRTPSSLSQICAGRIVSNGWMDSAKAAVASLPEEVKGQLDGKKIATRLPYAVEHPESKLVWSNEPPYTLH